MAEASAGATQEAAPEILLTDAVDVFRASLSRCTQSPGFLRAFYERFLQSSPEVARRFENTDFGRQESILEKSLHALADAVVDLPAGVKRLEEIAESHSRRFLDITPGLYELWLECLLETAAEFDPNFNARVRQAYRRLLGACIERMVAVYRGSRTAPPGRLGAEDQGL